MKIVKTLIVLLFCTGLLFGTSSCATLVRHDNGQHRGWNKSAKNSSSHNFKKHGKAKGKKTHKR